MAKNLLYKLFGLRKLSREVRERLHGEGILFDEEGTSCSLSFRKFRGPRNASGRGYESAHAGTLMITERTFYVQLPYLLLCDRPVDIAVSKLELELEAPARLGMTFDVEALFEDASGGLRCVWRTEHAAAILRHLESLRHRAPSTG